MTNGDVELIDVNGLKIANIYNDSAISFFGIGVIDGSNYETPNVYGISHFSEHMFFKGTRSRTWKQINEEFASIGANQNAYTSNNEVLYHCTCPTKNIFHAISMMSDMFFNSLISKNEIEKERCVIQEERKMYDDNHTSFFYKEIGDIFFIPKIGHATIGTSETIASIKRGDIIKYLNKNLCLENIIFITCGSTPIIKIKEYIKSILPDNHKYLRHGTKNICKGNIWNNSFLSNNKRIKLCVERDSITQSQVALLLNGLNFSNDLYFAQKILFDYIGGGMHSVLFERIREELGLCYSVGSHFFDLAYPEYVLPSVYCHLDKKNIDLFIEECEKQFDKIVKSELVKKTFECSKSKVLSDYLMATETSNGLANYMVPILLFGDVVYNAIDIVEAIENVSIDDCFNVATNVFTQRYNWAIMIPK